VKVTLCAQFYGWVEINSFPNIIWKAVSHLIETFNSAPGVGIAMPQIGVLERVVIVDASRQTKIKEIFNGQLILINPMIVKSEGSQIFREGCLSVPEYTGYVQRFEKIWVEAFDEKMNKKKYEFSGFESVIVQHEMDHLDGILFIDRVISPGSLFRWKKF
jgi:peptide deformylase